MNHKASVTEGNESREGAEGPEQELQYSINNGAQGAFLGLKPLDTFEDQTALN